MANLGPTPKAQFFYANGEPLVGGKVYTYEAGTTTPLTTYTDASAAQANTNPIILDSRGEANIWYGPLLYKIVLKDPNDIEIYTVDDLSGFPSLNNVDISGGQINGTTIGNVVPAAGTFTVITGAWASLPAGTKMLFVQSTAPTGWTKNITHDNKALRVVSGTASQGGSVDFTVAFSSKAVTGTVAGHALTISEMPAHSHEYGTGPGAGALQGGGAFRETPAQTSTVGGGAAHTHGFSAPNIDLTVKYVDAIIATKD